MLEVDDRRSFVHAASFAQQGRSATPFRYITPTGPRKPHPPATAIVQFSSNPQSDASMSASSVNLQDTLLGIQRRLDELDRKADDVLYKLDILFAQLNVSNAVGSEYIPTANIGWDQMSGRPRAGLNHAGTSLYVSGIPLDDSTAPLQGGSPHFYSLSHPYIAIPPSVHPTGQQLAWDIPGNLRSPQTGPAPSAFLESGLSESTWADCGTPQPLVNPTPLPAVAPSRSAGGCSESHEDFPGGGHDYRQRSDGSAQEAEQSTSLAAAKPQKIENDNQSESSTPASFGSTTTKVTRPEREKQKTSCLREMCRELDIPCTGDRLSDIQAIIRRLGWTVPPNGAAEGKRGKEKAWAECVKELRNHVGPWSERIVELGVLEKALEHVRGGSEKPPAGSEIAFCL